MFFFFFFPSAELQKLDDKEMAAVKAAISKSMVKAGSNLVLSNVVEPSVLAGVRVLVRWLSACFWPRGLRACMFVC